MPAFTQTATEPATPKSTSSGCAGHHQDLLDTLERVERDPERDGVRRRPSARSYRGPCRPRSGRDAETQRGQGVERPLHPVPGPRREGGPGTGVVAQGVGFAPTVPPRPAPAPPAPFRGWTGRPPRRGEERREASCRSLERQEGRDRRHRGRGCMAPRTGTNTDEPAHGLPPGPPRPAADRHGAPRSDGGSSATIPTPSWPRSP